MTSKDEMKCQRSHPRDFALRPTTEGDICVLFGTNLAEENASLSARQVELQKLYGGYPVPHIHLTCQRFSGTDDYLPEGGLSALTREIDKLLPILLPISITAVALVPLYVPFDRQNFLKWCIQVCDDFRAFADQLRGAMERAHIDSLYQPWFVPTLVTALKGLPSLDEKNDPYDNEAARFPQHLFTGKQLQLSRINARNDYDILAKFDW